MFLLTAFPSATIPNARADALPCGPIVGVKGVFPFCGFVDARGTFTTLKGLFFFGGQPLGINDVEQIADPYLGIVDAATGTVTPIAVPNAAITTPYGINDRGQVVGYYYAGSDRGFVVSRGVFSTLDPPGSTWTVAYGINNVGEVVGYSVTGSQASGFLFDRGTFSTIDFPGALNTFITGINDAGEVVGIYNDASGATERGFEEMGGVFSTIAPPGSLWSDAYGINDAGEVVGRYFNGREKGFLYHGGTFTSINFPGSTATDAQGIDNKGQIVGTAAFNVPESGTFLLLATVIGSLVGVFTRQKLGT